MTLQPIICEAAEPVPAEWPDRTIYKVDSFDSSKLALLPVRVAELPNTKGFYMEPYESPLQIHAVMNTDDGVISQVVELPGGIPVTDDTEIRQKFSLNDDYNGQFWPFFQTAGKVYVVRTPPGPLQTLDVVQSFTEFSLLAVSPIHDDNKVIVLYSRQISDSDTVLDTYYGRVDVTTGVLTETGDIPLEFGSSTCWLSDNTIAITENGTKAIQWAVLTAQTGKALAMGKASSMPRWLFEEGKISLIKPILPPVTNIDVLPLYGTE